jgi:hypothetical protein
MDHIRIVKRAFEITRSYRALWLFGILVALTSGGSFNGSSGGGDGGTGPSSFPRPDIPPDVLTGILITAALFGLIIILLSVVFIIARYVAETALIRMVDRHEATGERVSVRQGFRLGWSRAALRMFGLDFLVGLVGLLGFLLLVLVAASPLLVWLTDSTPARVLGTVVAVALGVVVIFLAILVSIAVSLLAEFWHRALVLEDRGIRSALRRGWQLLRQRLGDVLVMGLILFGLGLAWMLVLVPVFFLLLAVAAVSGGLPGLLVYAIGSLVAQGAAPWVAALIVAVPIFIVILAVPLAVLGGLQRTFLSSTWTLTFRELLALEAALPAPSPIPPAPPAPLLPAA